MQITGMLHGAKLLQFAGFPTSEVLGPDASEEEIRALIDRHGSVFIKPVFTLGWTRPAATLAQWWARLHGVPPIPLTWANTCGPLFGNTIATLHVHGRSAEVLFEQPRGPDALAEVGRVPLSAYR